MVDITAVEIFNKKIIGVNSINELVEKLKVESLYLYDHDSFRGKELGFRYYSELGDIYKLWVEARLRRLSDLVDTFVAGADIVVVSRRTKVAQQLQELLRYTEQIAVKVEEWHSIDRILKLGIKYLVSNKQEVYSGVLVVTPRFLKEV